VATLTTDRSKEETKIFHLKVDEVEYEDEKEEKKMKKT